MLVKTKVATDFGPEVEIMSFLHMRKKNGQNGCKCFPIVKIFDFILQEKGSLHNPMALSKFSREAWKLSLLRTDSKYG